MSAPLFTPGPWLVEAPSPNAVEPGTVVEVITDDGAIVADVYADTPRHARMATAHLIAAAPDLYAALAKLVEGVATWELCCGAENEAKRCPHDAARAALAKARGK